MKDLLGLSLEEMQTELAKLQLPAFRARQLFRHIHKNGSTDFVSMTDFTKDVRLLLQERFFITNCGILAERSSGDATKWLLKLPDGEKIETVLMSYLARKEQRERRTLCVSTQVGCAMGCVFCATGISSIARNLTTGEILAQIWAANHAISPAKVTNIVLMGMGEPLANYDAVIKAIRIINDSEGLNIGIRRIVLSTSGLVPGIRRLAVEELDIVLAISLHAPNDELRSKLMPINKTYPLEELLTAVDTYIDFTGRRVTFEYLMIEEVNDKPEHAIQLARLLKGKLANINLIPFNSVTELDFKRSSPARVKAFRAILTEKGLDAVIREEMGGEIEAACGQLRRQNQEVRDSENS